MKVANLHPRTTISTPDATFSGSVEWGKAVELVKQAKFHADFFVEKDALLAEAFPETKVPTAKKESGESK